MFCTRQGWTVRGPAMMAGMQGGRAASMVFAGLLAASLVASGARAQAAPAAQDPITTPAVAARDPMLAMPPDAPKQIATWEEALALIRAQSPDYATSREQVSRAEAAQRSALAPVLPNLNAQGSYEHQFHSETLTLSTGTATLTAVTPPVDTLAVSATASWAVINPRALYGLGTASRSADASRLSFSEQRRAIATTVIGAMLATLSSGRVAELNRVGLRTALERLGLTQARVQYGQGTALDVDRAQQDVAAARAQLITGDEALLESREAFGASLGTPTQVAANPSLDLESLERAVAQTCRLNDEIESRPDVRAAKLRVEIAERGVTDALLQIAPTFTVIAQAGYANEAVFAPNGTGLVEGLISIPLYDGGLRYAARRDAQAQAEQARQALESARINAVLGSARAQREVGVVKSSRDLAREQEDLARRVDERTRDAYAHGQGTSLDLVTSAQALRAADISLAVLEFQYAQARANALLTNAECAY